jgi:hypothetical protein
MRDAGGLARPVSPVQVWRREEWRRLGFRSLAVARCTRLRHEVEGTGLAPGWEPARAVGQV